VAPGNMDFYTVEREFRQLNTREAQAVFADRWLAIAASQFNDTWPMIYQMMQLVEIEQLYKEPRKLSGASGPGSQSEFPDGFETFQQYFEARVKQPFATWAELEHTYGYVTKYAPDLIAKAWGDARAAAAAHAQEIEAKDKATQRPVGANQYSEGLYNNNCNVQGQKAPTGNSAAAFLRRLRKDRPDIHARVLAGELSPHAGMVEAGFRKKVARKKSTPLDQLRKAWAKATSEERSTFLSEIPI